MNVTRYLIPLGTTAGQFNLPTGAVVYTGWAAARTAMNAGSWFGDILILVGTFGAADRDQIPSNIAAGAAMPSNVLNGGTPQGGIIFGTTSYGPGSKADGVTFDLRRAIIDARGGSAPSSRAVCAFGAVGERMTVLLGPDTRVYAPDYNYTYNAVATSGTQRAEEFSSENYGLMLQGIGNKVIGVGIRASSAGPFQVDAANGFSRTAVWSAVNGSTGSPHLMTYIGGFNVRGGNFSVSLGVGGYLNSGSSMPIGSEGAIDNIGFGGPSWGASLGVHQPGEHGGDFDLSGSWRGRARATRLIVEHGVIVQDCGQTIGTGVLISQSRLTSVGGSYTYLANAGSGVAWAPSAGTANGNGLKLGLAGYDNSTAGAPTAWLGADGTNGGAYAVPELCNIAHANQINAAGFGIAANSSGGMAFLYNRVRSGVCAFGTSRGNSFLVGNYGELTPVAAIGNAALMAGSGGDVGRLYLYNNMLVSTNPSHYDMRLYASALAGSANANNAFGSGRILVSGTDNYTEANDINGAAAVDLSAWDWENGWPDGHWLKSGGTRAFVKTLRTQYGDINARLARIGMVPAVGPI